MIAAAVARGHGLTARSEDLTDTASTVFEPLAYPLNSTRARLGHLHRLDADTHNPVGIALRWFNANGSVNPSQNDAAERATLVGPHGAPIDLRDLRASQQPNNRRPGMNWSLRSTARLPVRSDEPHHKNGPQNI